MSGLRQSPLRVRSPGYASANSHGTSDVDAQDFAVALGVDPDRDQRVHVDDSSVLVHLQDQGVGGHERVAASILATGTPLGPEWGDLEAWRRRVELPVGEAQEKIIPFAADWLRRYAAFASSDAAKGVGINYRTAQRIVDASEGRRPQIFRRSADATSLSQRTCGAKAKSAVSRQYSVRDLCTPNAVNSLTCVLVVQPTQLEVANAQVPIRGESVEAVVGLRASWASRSHSP
jgi:hypothetical protein